MNFGAFAGGQEWAQQVAPELRRISQKDKLEKKVANIAARGIGRA